MIDLTSGPHILITALTGLSALIILTCAVALLSRLAMGEDLSRGELITGEAASLVSAAVLCGGAAYAWKTSAVPLTGVVLLASLAVIGIIIAIRNHRVRKSMDQD
jgi:F0F1-type ATP synthase assembly protein I